MSASAIFWNCSGVVSASFAPALGSLLLILTQLLPLRSYLSCAQTGWGWVSRLGEGVRSEILGRG